MPIIEVHLLKGQPSSVRTRIMNAMTDALRMIVPSSPAAITVVLHEMDQENHMRGGAMRRRETALEEPISVVTRYLDALRKGDLSTAVDCLTEDAEMHLPGGAVVNSPAEVAEWLLNRSPSLGFEVQSTETSTGEQGPVVHMSTLAHGVAADGTPFKDVRNMTRFVLLGSRIRRIELWSDLAEFHLNRRNATLNRPADPDTDIADR